MTKEEKNILCERAEWFCTKKCGEGDSIDGKPCPHEACPLYDLMVNKYVPIKGYKVDDWENIEFHCGLKYAPKWRK